MFNNKELDFLIEVMIKEKTLVEYYGGFSKEAKEKVETIDSILNQLINNKNKRWS